MKVTPLRLIVAAFVMAVVLLVVVVIGATKTTSGEAKPVVQDSLQTIVRLGKLEGWWLYRIDDHDQRVGCYVVVRGGVDCDRSFYRVR